MRLQAIKNRSRTYYDSTTCDKHGGNLRWTGSGRRTCCFPRARGTLAQAMSVLFKNATVTPEQAQAEGLPMFNSAKCRRGHTAWRYLSTPHICPDCARIAKYKRDERAEQKHQKALAAYRDLTAPAYGIDYQTARALGLK